MTEINCRRTLLNIIRIKLYVFLLLFSSWKAIAQFSRPIIVKAGSTTVHTIAYALFSNLTAEGGTVTRVDANPCSGGSCPPVSFSIHVTWSTTATSGFVKCGAYVHNVVIDNFAPSEDENYIVSHVYRAPSTNGIDISTDINSSVTYFDGLGRPKQTVIRKGAPNKKDIIQAIGYDDYGRQDKTYLPYQYYSSNGQYHGSWETEVATFYNSSTLNDVVNESTYFYSEQVFEPSPLNRVSESFSPGTEWREGTNRTDRPVKYDYRPNTTADAIKIIIVDSYTDKISFSEANYDSGALWATETADENGNKMFDFKNKLGQVICKKSQLTATTYTSTYYVYDDFGLLRYVIQPEGVRLIEEDANYNWSNLNDPVFQSRWLFSYKYDGRKRMIEKKVPGAAPVYMVYDQRDRLVLTQDGNQRSEGFETLNGNVSKNEPATTNYYVASGSLTLQPGFHATGNFTATTDASSLSGGQWTFTKYDALNRPVMSGITSINGTRETIQNNLNTDLSASTYQYVETYVGNTATDVYGYNNTSYPQVTTADVLSVTYYDNHNFLSLSEWFGVAGSNNPYNYTGTITQNTKPKGLTTGGLTKVLCTQNMLPSVTYYDSRYRPIQNISGNHLGGTEKITTEYFNVVSPNVESVTRVHQAGTITKIIQEEYTYDHMDRLLTTKTTIDGNSSTITHTYNEIGELIKKDLNGVQEVDYQYNIRGWLTKINDGTALTGDDVFGMELKYTDAGYKQYNGNIGQILWKGVDESTSTNDNAQDYKYKYDPLNRLKKAEHTSGSNLGYFDVGGNDNGGIRYDANGNIKSLTRKYNNDLMDNLTYSYANGNQLSAVADAEPDAGRGFEETGSEGMQADEYLYDANGNMIRDANKKITNIQYNHLNLPKQVNYIDTDGNAQTVNYTYTAAGVKLKKETTSGSTIDYVSGIQYKGGSIDFVQHAEGRYKFGASSGYEYDLKDHLGNVRAVVEKESATGGLLKGVPSSYHIEVQSASVTHLTMRNNFGGLFKGLIEGHAWQNTPNGISLNHTAPTYTVNQSGTYYLRYYYYDPATQDYGDATWLTISTIEVESGPVIAIKQRDDYYPFGLTFNSAKGSPKNLYTYNGKEEQEETGWIDYGARMYMPDLGRWGVVDPAADVVEMSSPYVYSLNNPINYIDIDGELPIFINGRVSSDSERGSKSYWNAQLLETIKGSGIANPGGERHFVDGDRGMISGRNSNFPSRISNGGGMEAGARKVAGGIAAKADFEKILSLLERDPESGKIIEKIQIYTHSRGAAFGEGYTASLLTMIGEHADQFADPSNVVQYSLNLAPHQSYSVSSVSGVPTFGISHGADPASGTSMDGATNFGTNTGSITKPIEAHGTGSFVQEVGAFVGAISSNGKDNKAAINQFISAVQALGIEVTVQ